MRVDHRFNDNNTIFARYNVDNGVIVAPRSDHRWRHAERQLPAIEFRAAVPAHLLAHCDQ